MRSRSRVAVSAIQIYDSISYNFPFSYLIIFKVKNILSHHSSTYPAKKIIRHYHSPNVMDISLLFYVRDMHEDEQK